MSRLSVSPPDSDAAVRVTVRDWELRLVDHLGAWEELDIAPGRYLVSMPRPGREDVVKSVVVKAGQDVHVELGADAERRPGIRATAMIPAPAPPVPYPWGVRFLSGSELRVAGVASIAVEPSGDAIEVRASVQAPPGPLFAQVVVPGAVPRNIALPHAWGAAPGWTLRLRVTGDDARPAVVAPGHGRVAALAGYLAAGQIEEAAELAGDAERMLADKRQDVFGAAIGAYALLRMGRRNALHGWPYNLARWFDWLPDGAVIAAELALLDGEQDRARGLLESAAERGIPFFADGLSMLGRRVREGLVDSERAREVAGLTAFMELGSLAVALPGSDPAHPAGGQRPLDGFPPGQGWLEFHGAEAA